MSEGQVLAAEINGTPLLVEVAGIDDPTAPVGISDLSFGRFLDSLEAITDRVTATVRTSVPDRATVEFGVDVGVEAGQLTALLAKGSGTATLHITLEWDTSLARASATVE